MIWLMTDGPTQIQAPHLIGSSVLRWGRCRGAFGGRKLGYHAHLAHMDHHSALLLGGADKPHSTRAILTNLRSHECEGQPKEEFWIRFVAEEPDTDLKRRVPEVRWYYRSLADVNSCKAAAEERAAKAGYELNGPG